MTSQELRPLGRHELTSEGKLLLGVLVAFVAVGLLAALDLVFLEDLLLPGSDQASKATS